MLKPPPLLLALLLKPNPDPAPAPAEKVLPAWDTLKPPVPPDTLRELRVGRPKLRLAPIELRLLSIMVLMTRRRMIRCESTGGERVRRLVDTVLI